MKVQVFCDKRKKKRLKYQAVFSAWLPFVHSQFYLKGMLDMIIPADKKVFLTVTYRDKKGNVAKIDGLPVWTTSDASITPLEPPVATNGDDPAGVWALGGVVGLAQVSVTADVNLDPNVMKPLTSILETETIAGEAFAGVINTGSLVNQ
jgi:hypothetical protein